MDEKNELSDIVLNKNDSSNSNKKIILAIATLGVVLIVVVMLMNSINSKGTSNLPQAVLPPEPKAPVENKNSDEKEPLFENVPVVQENHQEDTNLDHIAKKLKQESMVTPVETEKAPAETKVVKQQKIAVKQQRKVVKKVKVLHKKSRTYHKKVKKTYKKVSTTPKHAYFIQVGSFSKYTPNRKFLNSITRLGYKYSYRKVKNINKVLVGPFNTRKEAIRAKSVLRSKVVRGAFLIKL